MAKWILIIIFVTGGGSAVSIESMEFNSRASCESAQQAVLRQRSGNITLTCVPK